MTPRLDIQGYDFHCHVDLHQDPAELIERCEAHRIVVLAVTTTPRAWPQNQAWTTHSRYVHSSIGLHPELVHRYYEEISILEARMDETRLVGEIGLDGSRRYRQSLNIQLEVFSRVVKRASELGGRVLSIHSRHAANQVLDTLSRYARKNTVLPILHWYSGSRSTASKALGNGCYFSINFRMLESESGQGLVEFLPSERLLVETDAPFTFTDNQKYDTTNPIKVADQIASLKGIPRGEFTSLLRQNATTVFGFADIEL
ncbi:MAG: TatD family hydrolase [Gammaproteobacteria bacterium]|nr:TatD family hydrolase [Gammaproteobacteria bacterium]